MGRFRIDVTLSKIFNEVYDEFKDQGVTRDQIKEIFHLLWYNTRQLIKSSLYPTIIFPGWGTYSPKMGTLKKKQSYLKYIKDDEGYDEVTKVIERLENEKLKRKRNVSN